MGCGWERCDIDAHLRDEAPCGNTVHTWNRDPTIQRLCQIEMFSSDLVESTIQQLDLSFQKLQLAEQAS